MSSPLSFLIRTRGNHKQGMGDITGSLRLAEALLQMGHDPLIAADPDREAVEFLRDAGWDRCVTISSINEERELLRKRRPDVLVTYWVDNPPGYLEAVRGEVRFLAAVDDVTEAARRFANLRVNPLYPVEGATNDMRFVTLAPVFRELHALPRRTETVKSILVTQGGADTYGFTPMIVSGLSGVPEPVRITVVLGPAFQHDRELDEALRNASRRFDIIRNARNMPDLLMEHDLVITAAGNTLFEAACTGIPAVIVCGEEFEDITARRFQKEGYGVNLGFGGRVTAANVRMAVERIMADEDARRVMAEAGKRLVKGDGAALTAALIVERYQAKLVEEGR